MCFSLSAKANDVAQRAQQICASCHGASGISSIPGMPSLAGQPKVFIENQLVMIREGLREIPAMKGILNGLSDPDVTALAKWYADQPLAPSPARSPDAAKLARGATLAKQALCGTCHLPSYLGQNQVPRLAGQREDYLLTTLTLMRDGKAQGRDSLMTNALGGISDAQLSELAHYFAHHVGKP
ncbi:MAG: cytochrome c4 [Betaproteobacteria bacterium]|nr:cytochrome c4 [Betaproteobacteria bacterium]NBT74606.1 cytochrome c4 [Betaproteobacteria bacterium]NBY13928.1 cytochrome c4 [Betaproteobacteria bacterium]NCA15923.1 cytochrome c4 [Betaproteobacteria bacterium]NDF03805.1 cytochrome c4 [Betaproteobacteria bacterium]